MFLTACFGIGKSADPARRSLPTRPLVLWVDWAGTSDAFRSASETNEFVATAKRAGVTHLALEARDRSGRPALGAQSVYRLQERNLRSAAQQHGILLAAAIPVFHADEATAGELRSSSAIAGDSGWELVADDALSPVIPGNRERELELIESIATSGDFDFLVLSQPGFAGLYSDLGPAAKRAFEAWTGRTMGRWPEVIIGEAAPLSANREGKGALWDLWLIWRADVMLDFMLEVNGRLAADGMPPAIVAVEGPWPAHIRGGLNWALPQSKAGTDYGWLPRNYDRTAAGHLLPAVALGFWEPDLIFVKDAELEDFAWWSSMEGSSLLARRYRRTGEPVWGVVPLFSSTAPLSAIQAAGRLTDGVILLSASDFIEHPELWGQLR